MKTEELMIGDWVKVKPSGMVIMIAAVHHKKVAYHAIPTKLEWVRQDLLEPIPLTADILRKSGFPKSRLMGEQRHFTYYLGPQLDLLAIYDADFSFNIGSGARYVKYVHELQRIMHTCKIEKKIIIE